MNCFVLLNGLVLAGLCLAGCAERPTREEFLAKEMRSLELYCASNAVPAAAALRDCVQYAQLCQEAGIKGIQYDEVFARLYGRLYLVERHLGHTAEAEQCLEKYSHFHAANSSFARRNGRPHGEMEKLIEQKYDGGLQAAWRGEWSADATGRTP